MGKNARMNSKLKYGKYFVEMIMLTGILILLTACGSTGKALPKPDILFSQIEAEVNLPDMIDVSGDMLENLTGISPGQYNSAVFYMLSEGVAPDEVIIIQAKDDASAQEIQDKLSRRLESQRTAAQQYLTEFQPVLQEAVIRRDGLTLSLLVSEQVSEIEAVYDALLK